MGQPALLDGAVGALCTGSVGTCGKGDVEIGEELGDAAGVYGIDGAVQRWGRALAVEVPAHGPQVIGEGKGVEMGAIGDLMGDCNA